MERLRAVLRSVPARERDEFLREIQSHIYEAYQGAPGEDDIARILGVLRNIGEPSDVASDRLPGAIVRSGTSRNLPLHIVGGVLIALFGIPLGFGGVAVLAGTLATLAGLVAAYYATVGVVFLTGALFLSLGLTRVYLPGFWERLVTLDVIQIDGRLADFLDPMSASEQGFLLILAGGVFAAVGLGMLWLGQHLVRGLRFLFSLAFEWVRKFAQSIRRKRRLTKFAVLSATQVSFAE
jgi:uncharacterized membrane protein